MKRFAKITALVSLTLLLAVACRPAATPPPTTTSSSIPTSKATLTNTPSPTNTPFPPAPTPTPRPTRTPHPTGTPKPTLTPTLTPTPLPDIFRPVIPIDEESLGNSRELHTSPDGTLWLITEQSVARLLDDTWSVYLSDYAGHVAGIDATGRVWVISEDNSQISAWDGGSWTVYGAEEGWTPLADTWYHYASGGQSDAMGRLWFGTSQDVRVFDGERWTVIPPEGMGMGPPMNEWLGGEFKVSILNSGAVWVLECDWGGPGPFGGRGARWFDGTTWHGADSPVASGCATVITEDDAGRVWMGVEENVWRYDPASGAWAKFAPPEPPIEGRFGFLEHLAVDSSGDPWPMIVICGGASCYGKIALYHVHDGVWTQIGDVAEYDIQWGPIFDADGTPWVFWDDGSVYRIVQDTPELMSSLYARSAVVDGSGRVWFLAWYDGRAWLWMLDL
jgi:hypothetical protein